jgi:hypothetical protein
MFREDSLKEFAAMNKKLFLGEDRVATKAYLKLFIEKIVIKLPRVDITCKSNILLAAMENKTAVRTGEALTADINWLPRTYNCKNFIATLFMTCMNQQNNKISILTIK